MAQLVAERYRLQSRVGEGAMGVVWQALDERLDRGVAVKQLRLPPALTPDESRRARQRMFREARIAARLHHPHAVAVYDVVDDGDGQPLLVLEYLPSHSLATLLTERGTLPVERVAQLGAQVASALAAAHAAGIVHRDVKPGNILLGDEGATKITDFGIAHASGDVTVTQTGLLAGTPAFLSPEAARGEQPGPAADVFSLGATLYTAVEGAPPFGPSDNPIALLRRVAAGNAPPPRHAGPLTNLLIAMLRDDPAARPTMAQLATDLTAVATSPATLLATPSTASIPPPTRLDLHPLSTTADQPSAPPGRTPSPSPSRGSRYALLGLVAAGLLALLITLLAVNQPKITTSGSPPSSGAVAADPTRLEQAVVDYYRLLPDHPDQAWARLGPELQTQNRDRYEQFWHRVTNLKIITPPQARGDTVTVQIEYTTEPGGRIQETHQLGMLIRNEVPLINTDQVLSTKTIPAEDNHDNDDTKGKKGKKNGN